MYTRKQFFIMGAKHCFDFARACSSILSLIKDENKKDIDQPDNESLFLEAMRLGIDPGTMDNSQLSRTVKFLKERK